jgi:hypothetical protein
MSSVIIDHGDDSFAIFYARKKHVDNNKIVFEVTIRDERLRKYTGGPFHIT